MRNVGHIGHLVVVSEEAIAKGVRRIVAVTGPEAERALQRAVRLETALETLEKSVADSPKTAASVKQFSGALNAFIAQLNEQVLCRVFCRAIRTILMLGEKCRSLIVLKQALCGCVIANFRQIKYVNDCNFLQAVIVAFYERYFKKGDYSKNFSRFPLGAKMRYVSVRALSSVCSTTWSDRRKRHSPIDSSPKRKRSTPTGAIARRRNSSCTCSPMAEPAR